MSRMRVSTPLMNLYPPCMYSISLVPLKNRRVSGEALRRTFVHEMPFYRRTQLAIISIQYWAEVVKGNCRFFNNIVRRIFHKLFVRFAQKKAGPPERKIASAALLYLLMTIPHHWTRAICEYVLRTDEARCCLKSRAFSEQKKQRESFTGASLLFAHPLF